MAAASLPQLRCTGAAQAGGTLDGMGAVGVSLMVSPPTAQGGMWVKIKRSKGILGFLTTCSPNPR